VYRNFLKPTMTSTGVSFALLALACESGQIGQPCIPEDEYSPILSGFSLGEINVESPSLQCESRLCLVNHFQGRVSCPYGQTGADLGKPGTAPERCRIPGTAGQEASDQVKVPVAAWNVERPPEVAVYCSCRCDGPDPSRHYCRCPPGYECRPLLSTFGLGSDELEGSYCLRAGTEFRPTQASALSCRDDPTNPACPGEPGVNP
jgi:hypothetical protein